jgi:predicted glycosyltransferase
MPWMHELQLDCFVMNRLDLLIYAHDGRGLGHASRSVAIGLAVRRLFPELKVLFLSGARQSAGLIGEGGLDWIKLPAYQTRVGGGISKGCDGESNFTDRELGVIRSGMIRDVVARLNPRCVLSDHMPQGKHRELLPALEACGSRGNTHWMLGMRGVIGDVAGVWSDDALSAFRRFYKEILWYGDRAVLGESIPEEIAHHFGQKPTVTGYVSRLAEWRHTIADAPVVSATLAATVSIPWIGEHTLPFLKALAGAIERIGPSVGKWHIYLGRPRNRPLITDAEERLRGVAHCRLFEPGAGYFNSLIQSRIAIIYGGYNSLTDLLHTGLSGLVVLRNMADLEQQAHLERLTRLFPKRLPAMNEVDCNRVNLEMTLLRQLQSVRHDYDGIQLDGAENAARRIHQAISDQGNRFS